jgi:hypothetical protein
MRCGKFQGYSIFTGDLSVSIQESIHESIHESRCNFSSVLRENGHLALRLLRLSKLRVFVDIVDTAPRQAGATAPFPRSGFPGTRAAKTAPKYP